MRTSQRLKALDRELLPTQLGTVVQFPSPASGDPADASKPNDSDVPVILRNRKPNPAQMTLLGPGVSARAPSRAAAAPVAPVARDAAGDVAASASGVIDTDKVVTPESAAPARTPTLKVVPMPLDDEDEEPAKPNRWQVFEDLGLVRDKAKTKLSKGIVSIYRLLGFAILTIIVVVLVSYIVTSVFYYLNKSWIAPVAVSPSDEKVLAARSELLAMQDQRDRTAAELAQTERVIAAHASFQSEFGKAIQGDRSDRLAALARLKALAASAARTRSQIASTTNEFASKTESKMAKEFEAGLIDQNTALAGKYQIAQMAGANLTIAERQADYESKAMELENQARALEAIVNGKSGRGALSYEVLKIKREYTASQLELAKAKADRDVLKTSLARQDQQIADIKSGAYLRAVENNATVALVPYANLDGVGPGTPLQACRLGFLVCREVGQVREVLRGEVTFKHPRRDAMVRGQMVELQLDDPSVAQDDVLFVGGKPLGI